MYNVVNSPDTGEITAMVGSLPSGSSWVGAFDMSGNVWEWVSSLYMDYEYNGDDGREDFSSDDDFHITRGGSFMYFDTPNMLRSAYRKWNYPWLGEDIIGVRCVRNFNGSE